MPDYTVGEGESYSTIQAAIDAIPDNLLGTGIHRVLVNYYDADDHSIGYPETIDAYTGFINASASDYIEILPTVAHNGCKGTGIKITFPNSSSAFGIRLNAYCRFHGFEINGLSNPVGSFIALTSNGAYARMYDNILHDIVVSGTNSVTVIELSAVGNWAYNNQIFYISSAGTLKGIEVTGNGTPSNNIRVMCNSVPQQVIDLGNHTNIFAAHNYTASLINASGLGSTFSNNITAVETGDIPYRAAEDQFVSLSVGNEDLHLLRTGACNRAYGLTLAPYFTTDCAGTTRIKGCVGAIENTRLDAFLRGGSDALSIAEAAQLPHFDLSYIADHTSEMLDNLIEFFKHRPIIETFLTAVGRQLQELENAYWSILLKTYLDVAEGENLNILGRVVGEPRDGRVDPDYRIAIRARIKMNQCSGTPTQLLEILNILYPRGLFEFEERFPAAFRVHLNGRNPQYPTKETFYKILMECKTGGVGMRWHEQDDEKGFVFRFSVDDDFEPSLTEGFSDDYGLGGGHWSDVYDGED